MSENTQMGRAPSRRRRGDWLTILACGFGAMAAVLFWMRIESGRIGVFPPFEDASMLFRYAENLAHGYGISWNPGEAPGVSDGATDLGFVLAVGFLMLFGSDANLSAAIISWAAVFTLGALIAVANRSLWRLPVAAPFILTLILSSGPLNRYIATGFSPIVFGSLLLGAGILSALAVRRNSAVVFITSGALAGAAGWWRPEGFALGPLVVIASALAYVPKGWMRRHLVCWRHALYCAASYLAILLAWMTFRLLYFGQLLPTSAVMKGGSQIVTRNGPSSLIFYASMLAPVLSLAVLASLRGVSRRYVAIVSLIVAAFSWVLIDTTMNWWYRMQWPLVPPLLLLFVGTHLARDAAPIPPRNFGRLLVPAIPPLCLLVGILSLVIHGIQRLEPSGFHVAASTALAGVPTQTLRVATTEAGLIPSAISGVSLDTYGHNNRRIAESKGSELRPELDRFAPNVIVVHGRPPVEFTSGGTSCEFPTDLPRWNDMVEVLFTYAKGHSLRLLRSTVVGTCEAYSIFVTAEVPEQVVSALGSFYIDGVELIKA